MPLFIHKPDSREKNAALDAESRRILRGVVGKPETERPDLGRGSKPRAACFFSIVCCWFWINGIVIAYLIVSRIVGMPMKLLL
jgi:hypothetical protein